MYNNVNNNKNINISSVLNTDSYYFATVGESIVINIRTNNSVIYFKSSIKLDTNSILFNYVL